MKCVDSSNKFILHGCFEELVRHHSWHSDHARRGPAIVLLLCPRLLPPLHSLSALDMVDPAGTD